MIYRVINAKRVYEKNFNFISHISDCKIWKKKKNVEINKKKKFLTRNSKVQLFKLKIGKFQ